MDKLHEVARMTSLAMLLYASSSWWGFTSVQDRQRLESIVRRMIRWGVLADDAPTFESLVSASVQNLLQTITPNQKHTGYNLRPRAHVYELPDKDDHNFIKRLRYKNIYCKKT